jgi:hypothetical protein
MRRSKWRARSSSWRSGCIFCDLLRVANRSTHAAVPGALQVGFLAGCCRSSSGAGSKWSPPAQSRVQKSKVAVLRVATDTILSDIDRLVNRRVPTRWCGTRRRFSEQHLLALSVPAANARRGSSKTIGRSRDAGSTRWRPEQDGRHPRVQGQDLNHYVPIFKRYNIPVRYNFRDGDATWVRYTPKARYTSSTASFPKASHPDYFLARTSSICRRRSATSTRRPAP